MPKWSRQPTGSAYVRGDDLIVVVPDAFANEDPSESRPRTIPLSFIREVGFQAAKTLAPGILRIGALVREPPNYDVRLRTDLVSFPKSELDYYQSLYEWLTNVVAVNKRLYPPESDIQRAVLPAQPPAVSQVPYSREQQETLILQRPAGWEFRLFAGVLLERQQELESKWMDHELRFAPLNGKHFDARSGLEYLSDAFEVASAIIQAGMGLFDKRNIEKAFGPQGVAGDPDLIRHLAVRVIGVYESLLDWAADVRGTTIPDELRMAFELAAETMDEPLRILREFNRTFVSEVEQLSVALSSDEKVPIYVTAVIEMRLDEQAMARCQTEIARVRKKLGLR